MKIHNRQIFVHNSALCYRNKVVKKFLKQNSIQILEWLGNTPYFNLMKNLWIFMKNKVSE